MQITFYSKKITKQQFDFIHSNWKNISEIEEETDILDLPKNRMKMVLRVPVRFRGNNEFMTVNCFILTKEEKDLISVAVLGNLLKPIFIALLAASPVSLVIALLFMKPFLFILVEPFVAAVISYYYLNRIKTTSQKFINELLKAN